MGPLSSVFNMANGCRSDAKGSGDLAVGHAPDKGFDGAHARFTKARSAVVFAAMRAVPNCVQRIAGRGVVAQVRCAVVVSMSVVMTNDVIIGWRRPTKNRRYKLVNVNGFWFLGGIVQIDRQVGGRWVLAKEFLPAKALYSSFARNLIQSDVSRYGAPFLGLRSM